MMDKAPTDDIFRLLCALGFLHYTKILEYRIKLSNVLNIVRFAKLKNFSLKPTSGTNEHNSKEPFERLYLDTGGPIKFSGT